MSDFDARYGELRTRMNEEHGPIIADLFVSMFCNGCGLTVSAPTIEELRPELGGWQLSSVFGGDDYCPQCMGRA